MAVKNLIQQRFMHIQFCGSIKTIYCSVKDDTENKQVSKICSIMILYGYLNCR